MKRPDTKRLLFRRAAQAAKKNLILSTGAVGLSLLFGSPLARADITDVVVQDCTTEAFISAIEEVNGAEEVRLSFAETCVDIDFTGVTVPPLTNQQLIKFDGKGSKLSNIEKLGFEYPPGFPLLQTAVTSLTIEAIDVINLKNSSIIVDDTVEFDVELIRKDNARLAVPTSSQKADPVTTEVITDSSLHVYIKDGLLEREFNSDIVIHEGSTYTIAGDEGTTVTHQGKIDGTGALKVGGISFGEGLTGKIILSGIENSYTGGTTVANEATLVLNGAAKAGTGVIVLQPGANFEFAGASAPVNYVNDVVLDCDVNAGLETYPPDLLPITIKVTDERYVSFPQVLSSGICNPPSRKTGDGTFAVRAPSQFSGGLTIEEGLLEFAFTSPAQAWSEGPIYLQAPGAISFSGTTFSVEEALDLEGSFDSGNFFLKDNARVDINEIVVAPDNEGLRIAGDKVFADISGDQLLVSLQKKNTPVVSVEQGQLLASSLTLDPVAAGKEILFKDGVLRYGDVFVSDIFTMNVSNKAGLDPNGFDVAAPAFSGSGEISFVNNSGKGGFVTVWVDPSPITVVPNNNLIEAYLPEITINEDQVISFVEGSNSPTDFTQSIQGGGTVAIEAPEGSSYALNMQDGSKIKVKFKVDGGLTMTIASNATFRPAELNLSETVTATITSSAPVVVTSAVGVSQNSALILSAPSISLPTVGVIGGSVSLSSTGTINLTNTFTSNNSDVIIDGAKIVSTAPFAVDRGTVTVKMGAESAFESMGIADAVLNMEAGPGVSTIKSMDLATNSSLNKSGPGILNITGSNTLTIDGGSSVHSAAGTLGIDHLSASAAEGANPAIVQCSGSGNLDLALVDIDSGILQIINGVEGGTTISSAVAHAAELDLIANAPGPITCGTLCAQDAATIVVSKSLLDENKSGLEVVGNVDLINDSTLQLKGGVFVTQTDGSVQITGSNNIVSEAGTSLAMELLDFIVPTNDRLGENLSHLLMNNDGDVLLAGIENGMAGTISKSGSGKLIVSDKFELEAFVSEAGFSEFLSGAEMFGLHVLGGTVASIAGDLNIKNHLRYEDGVLAAAEDLNIFEDATAYFAGTEKVDIGGDLNSDGLSVIFPASSVSVAEATMVNSEFTVGGSLSSKNVDVEGILNLNAGSSTKGLITVEKGGIVVVGAPFVPPVNALKLAGVSSSKSSAPATISTLNSEGTLEVLAPMTVEDHFTTNGLVISHISQSGVGTITVGGLAKLGGVLEIASTDCRGPDNTPKIPLLIAGGGIDGQFIGVQYSPSICSDVFKLVYTDQGIFLINLPAVQLADTACTCAQQCLQQAATDYFIENPVDDKFSEFFENVLLPIKGTAECCQWEQLVGEPYADLLPMGIYSARLTVSSVQKQLWRAHDLWLQDRPGWHGWMDGVVQYWSQGAGACDRVSGWNATGGSFDVGGDYRLGSSGLVGLAVNLQHSHGQVKPLDSSMNYSSYGGTLYGSLYHKDSFYLDGQIGGSYTTGRVKRNICLEDFRSCLSANLSGGRIQGRAEAGYVNQSAAGGVQPYVAFEGEWARFGNFCENCDSPAALQSWKSMSANAMFAEAGVRLFSLIQKDGWVLQPEIDVSYAYNFTGSRYSTNIGWLAAPSCCCFDGLNPVRNIVSLTAGAVAQIGEQWQVALRFNGEVGSQKWQSVGGNLQVSYAF